VPFDTSAIVAIADRSDFLLLACESVSSIIDKREKRFLKCFKTASVLHLYEVKQWKVFYLRPVKRFLTIKGTRGIVSQAKS
jgi:hypothetical protein